MNRSKLIFIGLLVALAVPLIFVFMKDKQNLQGKSLLLYCAAGMRIPVEKIAERYKLEYGVEIKLQFAGSGTLLGNIEASGQGDLFLAADSSYIEIAREKGLAAEAIPLSYLTAGLIVPKGNPLGLHSLNDLIDRETLRIVLANPEAASVGKFTREVLSQAGVWDAVEEKVLAMKPTVNDLANDVKLGSADVAIAWDAVAAAYEELEFVSVPEFEVKKKEVTVSVLTSTKSPSLALHFARYLGASDRGLEVFRNDGYEALDGDKWESRPELTFYSGAMLQPAIRERMEKFQEREGVELKFVPNGCGILVSQMRAGERPDAYFSCDVSFMDQVRDLFEEPSTVSANDLVLLSRSEKITRVEDLAREDVKVGLAHPEKSALGALTVKVLVALAVDTSKSKQLDSATGDFLVNQLRAGSLDAVIVYRSNAMAHPETLKELKMIAIDHPLALARQPFAVGKNSEHKRLAGRLFDALTDADGKAAFLKYGFQWER